MGIDFKNVEIKISKPLLHKIAKEVKENLKYSNYIKGKQVKFDKIRISYLEVLPNGEILVETYIPKLKKKYLNKVVIDRDTQEIIIDYPAEITSGEDYVYVGAV